MWPGSGCFIGGKASSESDTYATQPGSIPTSTSANGIWTPDDAAYYLRQGFRGLEWPGQPDPSFSSVKVLIHMDRLGQNGNMRMLPTSRSPNDCDAYEIVDQGAAGLLQDVRKGGLYVFQLASTEAIIHNVSNAIALGTGDLTAEGFFHDSNATFNSGGLWDFRANSSDATRPSVHRATGGKIALLAGGADIITSAAAVTPTNAFHHFAWCRASGTSYLYVDGVSVGSAADANNYASITSAHIGNNVSVNANGAAYVDEFRLTVGVARYPGGTTFTVPTVPFPDY